MLDLSKGVPFEEPKLVLNFGISRADFLRDYAGDKSPEAPPDENVISLQTRISKYRVTAYLVFSPEILDEIVFNGIWEHNALDLFGKPDREGIQGSLQWTRHGLIVTYVSKELGMGFLVQFLSIRPESKETSIVFTKDIDKLSG